MVSQPALSCEALSVRSNSACAHRRTLLQDVSFALAAAERVGIVGASGSGKTTLALALLGLLPSTLAPSGHLVIDGERLPLAPARVRPTVFAALFQEPASSLNPFLTIGSQLDEAQPATPSGRARRERSEAMLQAVGLPQGAELCRQFAHRLSGGTCQRIALAMAMLAPARCLVADEPTTALDATVQLAVLEAVLAQCRERGRALLFVTHDLAVLAKVATRVLVMDAGRLVEDVPVETFFAAATRPASQRLLAEARATRNLPRMSSPARTLFSPSETQRNAARPAPRASNVERAEVLVAHGLSRAIDLPGRWPWSRRQRGIVVREVSLAFATHEVVALIGESGSGKSSLGRLLAGLDPPTAGTLERLPTGEADSFCQMIWQHPRASLESQQSVRSALQEAISSRGRRPNSAAMRAAIEAALAEVGLASDLLPALPSALSGGQAQRVALARALLAQPRLLVADEATSALDASSRAHVVGLLGQLAEGRGLSILLITHDLSTVEAIADRALVMFGGRIIERAPAKRLLEAPLHPYSRALMDARLDVPDGTAQSDPHKGAAATAVLPATEAAGAPSIFAKEVGCAYAPRCPKVHERCRRERPLLVDVSEGRAAACHLLPSAPAQRRPKG